MYSSHKFDTKTRNIVSQCFSIYCKTVFNCSKVLIKTSIQRVILVRSSLCPGMVLTATARISALNHRLSRPNYCLNTRDMLVSKLNCNIVAQYIHSHQLPSIMRNLTERGFVSLLDDCTVQGILKVPCWVWCAVYLVASCAH